VSDEAELLAFLVEREDELVEFARELIATPSVNPPGDERAVAALVRARLSALGIEDVQELSAVEGRPSVMATVPGSERGRRLMLCGHLDTKPPGDLEAWRTDPWDPRIEDGELYGLGSGDMKAAVAAMVYAAGAVRAAGLPVGSLVLALEPCGVVREWEAIDLVSRGAALFKVRVRGTQTHSSISDRFPVVNATVAMARLVERMHRELKDALSYDGHPLGGLGPTVNVGVMASAGVFYGVYPGEAEFACDIRTLPGMTGEGVRADVEAFLQRAMADDPELHAELVFEAYIAATEIGPDEPVVEAVRSAAADVLGEAPPLAAFPGATDAAAVQGMAGIPAVAAFGPGFLPRAHSPNEAVPVKAIGEAAQMYALAAWRYVADPTA
jgi:acetylornithine deacetylase/succinyl-diaminopimelate desuccinylase-like protein